MLLGVDFGTGGCKATVIDREGNVLAAAFEEYPSAHPRPGWSEQNPDNWIAASVSTIRRCLAEGTIAPRDIAGIGLSASTHNAVLLDGNGTIIRPAIMWNDQRSAPQAERLAKEHGERIFAVAMQMPTATWTMPQLLWIRENDPDSFARIRRLLFTKDFVRNFLTGDFCTDHVDAQGSLLYDARRREWSAELCSFIGLPVETLPPVLRTTDIAGVVGREAASATGLAEGTPVIAGCSDTAAEDYGSGAVESGQLLVKMATAGNVNRIADAARPHPKTYTYPYPVEGMWYTVTGTNASASAYRWLRDTLYCGEKAACEQTGKDVYRLMDEDAASVPPGARGLLFHPYLLGERCPLFNADARGNFFGVSIVHDRRFFARAVLEGVAYSLYDCFQVIQKLDSAATEIRLVGGGAKSPLWRQIIADVFGLPVARPKHDDSSFGVALLAGVGTGVFPDEITAVRRCNAIGTTCRPDANRHAAYQDFFRLYRDIAQACLPLWRRLRDAASE